MLLRRNRKREQTSCCDWSSPGAVNGNPSHSQVDKREQKNFVRRLSAPKPYGFILASLVFPICSLSFSFYKSLSHLLSFNFHSSFLSLSHCRKREGGLQSEPPHLSPHSTLHNHPDYPPMRENKIQQKPKGNPSILNAAGTQKHTQPFNISGDLELYNPAAVEYCCRQGFLSSSFSCF